ncbi:2-C-methyl-D-erythritol 2,4-cyclodiphosphate synthase [Hazenella sp. IB182357]|uniref:2-C-methyl-D-erythritol 2,4-cyclodiphosphate synthase n=1 Tax=Polycladospora coralii TaxID=2771432 RepID=A0A926N9A1_9BACL|nr:2-C-methyl-D-erythritol 2,4-cyclodiphosphate synthase [Polycladospora coralii]MBD1371260.1 2-C-methyl-D-erythritol 2,4-cyclodiphosphate synthase [Polycladospora coralii]MBS7530203.1 2-C-methyl-D-erythritol 2,4-cyclodiphosphate synthase [Polycladospora coralii]MBS7530215.1 2-C-methyl-D-erythritol 2,4-cyclodiphosphate synthase [Polycladospora coralii]
MNEKDKKEIIQEVILTLSKKHRISWASDFHAFEKGRQLTLAGVTFDNFPKGPNTKRTDGDVVAHAIVMALGSATKTGDIDDWFPDEGETGIKSIEYLTSMRKRLIEPKNLIIGQVDVTIICGEYPRMKKKVPLMEQNIAQGLGINLEQVHLKVSSMDGNDEFARLEGIEARVIVSLWEDFM